MGELLLHVELLSQRVLQLFTLQLSTPTTAKNGGFETESVILYRFGSPGTRMPFITQILLPKSDNFGQPFDEERYRVFHTRMIRKIGGWTRKGQAEGAWLSPSGQLHADDHWVYEVGHSRRELRFWQAEKEWLKEQFGQEEIWTMQYEGRRI